MRPDELKVTEQEILLASDKLTSAFKDAVRVSMRNVKIFHMNQAPSSMTLETYPKEFLQVRNQNPFPVCGIIVCDSMNEAGDFVNKYAPEHLMIVTENPFDYLSRIKNASEILLGEHSPFTLANSFIAPNAVLPTGGFARTFSRVSVRDFIKYSSVSSVTQQGFQDLKGASVEISEYEGFVSHADALKSRGGSLL